jgi:hypothetical protein
MPSREDALHRLEGLRIEMIIRMVGEGRSAASVSRYLPTSASSLKTARISAIPNISRKSAESNTVLGKGSLPFEFSN